MWEYYLQIASGVSSAALDIVIYSCIPLLSINLYTVYSTALNIMGMYYGYTNINSKPSFPSGFNDAKSIPI